MSQPNRQVGSPGGDEFLMLAIVGMGIVALATWAGAQLAAILHSGAPMSATPADGFRALFRLPGFAADPRLAWESSSASLPGPVLYWVMTAAVVLVSLGLMVGLYLRFVSTRVGTDRKDRLGVTPQARLARRRDLKPLIVKKPTEGRFVMGRVGRDFVATEDRTSQSDKMQRRREHTRVGDRSAVVVVGPSRCGKTANVTAGVLDWDGPAILSSVKDDLYNATIERRRQLGKVFVFDPFGELPDKLGENVRRVGWSPLQASTSISGAQQAANTLLDAGPTEGVTNANYWSTKGQQLLWPMLFAAATNKQTMGDVVRWLALQDGNNQEDSEVARLLTNTMRTRRGAVRMEARQALTSFAGFWLLEARTRSDIFSTAQTVITAWEDPYVAAASATRVQANNETIIRHSMNMAMLLEDNNTLYMVQPLKSTERFSVLFGGLLGDLLRDQAYEISKRAGEPIPATLAVIDEAGNTPLRWLPEVASTCSGIGIQLVTVWQSLAQMRAIYQAQTDSLLTNHGSKIFFSGLSDRETLDYASYQGGEEEVTQQSTTTDIGRGDRRSVAASTARMRFLPGDLMRQIPPGSALLLHGTLPPAHLVGRRPWEEPRLQILAEGNGAQPEEAERSERLIDALATKYQVSPFVLAHMAEMTTRPLPEPPADEEETVEKQDETSTGDANEPDETPPGEADEPEVPRKKIAVEPEEKPSPADPERSLAVERVDRIKRRPHPPSPSIDL